MKKAIFNGTALLTAMLMPALAFAQSISVGYSGSGSGTPQLGYINSWLGNGLYYLKLSITVITILLTVYFLVSVLRFVMNKDAAKTKELQRFMINGLIGLFVSVAVWGIIRLAGNITGVDETGASQPTQIACPPGLNYQNGVCQ